MPPDENKPTEDAKPAVDPHADVKPGLSDEEKAALAAEDDADQVGAGAADKAASAGTIPQAVEDAKPDGDGAGTTDDAKPAAPPEIPRGRASATELTTSKDIDPAVAETRLGEIDTEIAALDAKLEAGDMEAKDYTVAQRALTGEQGDLKADLREVGFVQNANAQLANSDWNKSIDSFLQDNPEFDNPIKSGALNGALNQLYADDKNVGASHRWYLETAKRAVAENLTPAQAALDAPPVPGDPNAKAVADAKVAAAAAGDAKDKLPKTLGDVPTAGAADVGSDEFAALDDLTGMELEGKLAGMTQAQQDAYLRG